MKFGKVLYYRFSYNKSLTEGTINRTDDFLFLSTDFFPNENYRSKRHANSANNTREAKTTAVMIKEIHNILSEGRIRLCNQQMRRVSQVHPDRRETEDEKGREDHVEARETEVLWDYRGKVDPWDQKVILE